MSAHFFWDHHIQTGKSQTHKIESYWMDLVVTLFYQMLFPRLAITLAAFELACIERLWLKINNKCEHLNFHGNWSNSICWPRFDFTVLSLHGFKNVHSLFHTKNIQPITSDIRSMMNQLCSSCSHIQWLDYMGKQVISWMQCTRAL